MASAAKTKSWIQLDCKDQDARVVVTPDDGDRFAITMELAIRGCKIASQLDKFNKQLSILMGHLADWTDQYIEDIDKVYLGIKDDGLQFLVVRRSKRYNRDLEDALTNLDIAIAQDSDLDLIQLSVLALPKTSTASVQSFLPRRGSLVYQNAKRSRSHKIS